MRLTWPVLDTPRLVLRMLTQYDLGDVFSFASHPDVAALTGWPPHTSQADTREYLADVAARYAAKLPAPWGIVDKRTSSVIGTIGFTDYVAEHKRAVLGGAIAAEHWGRGLMTEAALCAIDHGFEKIRLNRIESLVRLDHPAAQRIVEKCGFQHEGELRDYVIAQHRPITVAAYSLLRADYSEMKQEQYAAARAAEMAESVMQEPAQDAGRRAEPPRPFGTLDEGFRAPRRDDTDTPWFNNS